MLKIQLEEKGISQVDIAKVLNVSKTAISLIINKGIYPKDKNFKKKFNDFLKEKGIEFETKKTSEDDMILQKNVLSTQAKVLFKLPYNFLSDVESEDDIYENNTLAEIRHKLLTSANNGKMIALIGESGSGKTTLIQDLESKLFQSDKKLIFIKPSVIGMADHSNRGVVLKATHIADSILLSLDPSASTGMSYQKKMATMRKALIESYKTGNRHCIVVEEAHNLNLHTLKHLKSLNEERIGFQRILGIILVGQQELKFKMSENHFQVRELVQRCELLELTPVVNIAEYLQFQCARREVKLETFADEDCIKALENIFNRTGQSLAYPLAINNLLTKAINTGASIGSKVNAEIINKL